MPQEAAHRSSGNKDELDLLVHFEECKAVKVCKQVQWQSEFPAIVEELATASTYGHFTELVEGRKKLNNSLAGLSKEHEVHTTAN